MNSTARTLIAPMLLCAPVLLTSLTGCQSLPAQDQDLIDPNAAAQSPADLYVDLAAAYLQRNQLDAALARAERAVREDRRSARARNILAIIYQRLGEQERAEEQFRRAVELDSRNPEFRNAWGTALCNRGDYAKADEQFNLAIDNPLYQSPETALFNASNCARLAGDAAQADIYLRQALVTNPQFAPALLAMATHSLNQDDAKTARQYMQRYSRVGAATPQALLLALRIERRLGNQAEARMLESSLRQHYPDAPEILQL